MRKLFVLFSCYLIIAFFSNFLFAQHEVGKPFITNYYAKDYAAHAQNWSITQDDRGIIYFANGDGILVYDSKYWELIKLPQNVTPRTVSKSENGIIYVGSINEFGYLRPNNFGKLEYISLIDSLGIDNIGEVWDIYHIDNSSFFRSDNYLIRLNSEGFTYWKAPKSFGASFKFHNHIYVHDPSAGLFMVQGDSLIEAPASNMFRNITFNFGVEINDEIRLVSPTNGLFAYDNNQLKHINCEANKYLINNIGNRGASNSDSQIIIATNNGGCIIIEENGKLIRKITTQIGLQSNNIHQVFLDKENNLWMALNKGIAKCDISSPISFWDQTNGLEGIVQNIIRYHNKLYIATHQGLYFIDQNNVIEKFPKNLSRIWYFLKYKAPDTNREYLFISTQLGIYYMKNGKLIKLTNEHIPFFMVQSKNDPNLIYVGFTNDIGVIKYHNGEFNFLGKIPNSGISVRSIIEDKKGNLWASTFRHGVIKIELSDILLEPINIKTYGLESGFPSLKNILIYPYKQSFIFATENGLYEYDNENNKFYPQNTFKNIFKGDQKDIFSFFEDTDGNVWIAQLNNKKGSIGVAKKNLDGTYTWNSSIFNRIPQMMTLSVYIEDSGNVWFGGTEGLFKYDPTIKKDFDNKFNAEIHRVTLNGDSTIFYGNYYIENNGIRNNSNKQTEKFQYEISYEYNSISFLYTALDFSNEQETEYQYNLVGFDKNWSDWSLITSKEYTNLPEGKYIFKVRARNAYNQLSNETSFQFTIKPPWYRSKVAYIFFFILGVILIFGIVRISIRRLKSLNIELERLVEKRTFEINQQKEEILAQSEELAAKNDELEKLSIIARETDNAIAIADPEGNIEWVNEGFRRLYGYTIDDLGKHNYTSLIDFSESEKIVEVIDFCKKNKRSKSYESLNNSKSGKKIWAQTTITPILDDNENIIKLIAIDSDITKLKLAELEVMQQKDEIQAQRDFAQQQKQFIEQQNKELEKHRNRLEQLVKERTIDLEIAKEKAEQSDKLKSAFLANMSHEIRTPMNAIIGFSNLLNEEDIAGENKEELVAHIIHNSNTLLHLIDDIIDLSKIEAGQLEINKKNCEVNNILNELFETFSEKKKLIYKEKIEIIFKPEFENNEFIVFTDPLRIQQVISNLMDNALKFTEKGYIEIGYHLSDEKQNQSVIFYVKDTGIGLTNEQQNQIFQRFTKFENDKKKLYRGAGLGLAICKNISTLLGGDLWVESEIEKGSTFFFSIPFIKKSASETRIIDSTNAPEDYNWKGKTILVAEDEVSNYRYIEMVLSKTNVKLIWATDGTEVFELFQKKDVDLILMDIKMPNMDGLEATRRIRQIDEEIPIIAQTAFAMENDEKLSIEAGCNDYISKPIRKHKLLELINKYF